MLGEQTRRKILVGLAAPATGTPASAGSSAAGWSHAQQHILYLHFWSGSQAAAAAHCMGRPLQPCCSPSWAEAFSIAWLIASALLQGS